MHRTLKSFSFSAMATQPALSTTFNLPVQTHILEPSLQPSILSLPISAPLSSQLEIFDGTHYRYQPEQFLNGMKARTAFPNTTFEVLPK